MDVFPMTIDGTHRILDGHGRYRALTVFLMVVLVIDGEPVFNRKCHFCEGKDLAVFLLDFAALMFPSSESEVLTLWVV